MPLVQDRLIGTLAHAMPVLKLRGTPKKSERIKLEILEQTWEDYGAEDIDTYDIDTRSMMFSVQ